MRVLGRSLLVTAALALLTACVSTQATRLGAGVIRPSVPPDRVAIYRSAAQVPGRYEEVALLSSSGDHSLTSEEQMFQSMRKKAGELGANAVVLDAMSDPGTGAKVAQAFLGTSADRRGKAIAIYVFPADSSGP
ncbi:MAG: hypothetical protein ACREON_01335 [Gemmatimonadaceae bacterium]